MAERLLYKNSCNLSALIHLLTVHEESTARYIRHQNNNDTNIVNLLNNVFVTGNYDISGSIVNDNVNNTLIYNDNSLNTMYLDEFRFSDISNVIYSTCPITRDILSPETQVIQIKTCKHYFKRDAFIPWLRQSNICPYCRASIINE